MCNPLKWLQQRGRAAAEAEARARGSLRMELQVVGRIRGHGAVLEVIDPVAEFKTGDALYLHLTGDEDFRDDILNGNKVCIFVLERIFTDKDVKRVAKGRRIQNPRVMVISTAPLATEPRSPAGRVAC